MEIKRNDSNEAGEITVARNRTAGDKLRQNECSGTLSLSKKKEIKIWKEKQEKKGRNKEKRKSSKVPKGKAMGLWDAARTKERVKHKEEPAVQFMTKIVNNSGLLQNCTPLYDVTSEMDWKSKYKTLNESQFKKEFMEILEGNDTQFLQEANQINSSLTNIATLDQKLFEELELKIDNEEFQIKLQERRKLPVWKQKDLILKTVEENQVIVVCGETGCGKTTQISQYLLDWAIESRNGSTFRAICTQPRRLAAISVAHRVAEERGEVCGSSSSSVGYQVRLERRCPRERGAILYCTTGILVKLLLSDPFLENVSHLLLDEVHERDLITDFILTVVRQLLQKRPKLRVILMSATIDSEIFSKYFDNCPVLNIQGRNFPVQTLYLEDILTHLDFRMRSRRQSTGSDAQSNTLDTEYSQFMEPFIKEMESNHSYPLHVFKSLRRRESEDAPDLLIVTLLKHICAREADGAILIFFPGWERIKRLHKILLNDRLFSGRKFLILTLHSMLPTINQRQIFDAAPRGIRKIILATNIAETSLTIQDVIYVIDCGKAKLPNFDPLKKVKTLNSEWITLASGLQRQGRAGRTKPGICYRLYSRGRESAFAPQVLPEIKRISLEELILQIKILKLGRIDTFISQVPEPPDALNVKISIELLQDLGALDRAECLTPLGFHLAQLPTDPRTGKLILFGAIFGCLEPTLSIAASLNFKDPFVIPLNQEDRFRKKKKSLADNIPSDHLLIAKIMHQFRAAHKESYIAAKNYCHENFLSTSTMLMLSSMMDQFCRDLHERQFVTSSAVNDPTSNINSNNHNLVLAVLCACVFPNVAKVSVARSSMKRNLSRISASSRVVTTAEDGDVVIHPRSVNYDAQFTKSTWLCYYSKIQSTSIYLHDCSVVSPFALLFFGGQQLLEGKNSKFFAELNCNSLTSERILTLHTYWENYLCHRVSHPGPTDWSHESTDSTLLKAIVMLTTGAPFSEQNVPMTSKSSLSDCDYRNLVASEKLMKNLSLSSSSVENTNEIFDQCNSSEEENVSSELN